MNKREIETEAITAKRPKLSHQDELDENRSPIPRPSNELSPPQPLSSAPKIFKLDTDCMDEIFEYLSLVDLAALAQTCIQKVTGEYFKQNYSSTYLNMESYESEVFEFAGSALLSTPIFNQLVTDIRFEGLYADTPLLYIVLHPNEFGAINRFIFNDTEFNDQMYLSLNGIFPKLETIRFYKGFANLNIYDKLLKRCTNLKCFELYGFGYYKIPDPHSWLRQKYPKLEHFGFSSVHSIDDLKLFFQNNPNVRNFCTYANDIWDHRLEIKSINVKLDLFKICIKLQNIPFVPFFELLNQLYAQKFYKRLHIKVFEDIMENSDSIMIDDSFATSLISLNGLESLCFNVSNAVLYRFKDIRSHKFLPDLPNSKEFIVLRGLYSSAFNIFLRKCVNLQRLHLEYREGILPIIQELPNLKVLILHFTYHRNVSALNILKLNTERQKVFNAQKVTIYVPNRVYHQTKWTTANGDTNLQMIELKRSYQSDSPFY